MCGCQVSTVVLHNRETPAGVYSSLIVQGDVWPLPGWPHNCLLREPPCLVIVEKRGMCSSGSHWPNALSSQKSWMGTCLARASAWMRCSTGDGSTTSTICTATPWRSPLQSKAIIAVGSIHDQILSPVRTQVLLCYFI